eukprot:247002-Alexandrium_andersonii.AAC.1
MQNESSPMPKTRATAETTVAKAEKCAPRLKQILRRPNRRAPRLTRPTAVAGRPARFHVNACSFFEAGSNAPRNRKALEPVVGSARRGRQLPQPPTQDCPMPPRVSVRALALKQITSLALRRDRAAYRSCRRLSAPCP